MTNETILRQTRSNSNTQISFTLNDIKTLINDAKEEIMCSFTEKINNLSDSINSIITKVSNLEERCSLLEDKLQVHESKCLNNVSLVSDEVERRFQRRTNIIISGLEAKMSGSLEERKDDDGKKCFHLLSRLGVSSEDSIMQINRIGRPEKIPMLKVTLDTYQTKQTVIRKAKELRTDFPNVYVNPDRTPMQQFQQRELRQELRRRRDNGEDVIIKGNSVVSRDSTANQNFR